MYNSVGIATDLQWMQQALVLAKKAAAAGEVPVGAVLVQDQQLLAAGWNQPIGRNDPTAHAEIMALREAARQLQNYRLPDTTLYCTLEPCSMCAGAIILARVKRVVFATADPRTGAAGSVYNLLQTMAFNHRCDITRGILAEQSMQLLQNFFASRRNSP